MTIVSWLEQRGILITNYDLIDQAFMHSSYVNEHKKGHKDNERLEFMGDAVLQLWTSEHLFKLDPILSEGKMTTYRAALVCEEALASYGRKLELPQFFKLGLGEEKTGGRNRDSIIADMFEAFLGALYLDCGFEAVNIILNSVINFKVDFDHFEPIVMDYKTKLQEYVQSDIRKTVSYEVLSVTGPSNNPIFDIAVMLDGIMLGKGRGKSKKKAEQQAAKDAFDKLVN